MLGRIAFIPIVNIREHLWEEIFEELERDTDIVSQLLSFIREKN